MICFWHPTGRIRVRRSEIKTKRKTYLEGRDDVMITSLNLALLPVGVDGLRKAN